MSNLAEASPRCRRFTSASSSLAERGVAETGPLAAANFPARLSLIQLKRRDSGMPMRRLASLHPTLSARRTASDYKL